MSKQLICSQAWLREDGKKGIRNILVVAYLVECAHHVARKIVQGHDGSETHLIGFPGCFPNRYASQMMRQLCTHANVGAVLLVSLGCESMDRQQLLDDIRASGRSAELLVIQQQGGTRATIDTGVEQLRLLRIQADKCERGAMYLHELSVGTICGGSDGTSAIGANPAVGHCFDHLIAQGATCIFEETGELIGCETVMAERAISAEVGSEIVASVNKAERYYRTLGFSSFAPGNAEGGLTTQEEKSMGAYAKSGTAAIKGLIKPGEPPSSSGLYLLDVVPDGEPRFGFPNIADNAEIVELIACGNHIILFTTGRGSVVGSAISPVIKICANPDTYQRMSEDMDVNAGKVLTAEATIAEVGDEILATVLSTAAGEQTASEALGHQEFILTYKTFDTPGPSCLPTR